MATLDKNFPNVLGTAMSANAKSVFELLLTWHKHDLTRGGVTSVAFVYDEQDSERHGFDLEFILRIEPEILAIPSRHLVRLRIAAVELKYLVNIGAATDSLRKVLGTQATSTYTIKSGDKTLRISRGAIFERLIELAPTMTYATGRLQIPSFIIVPIVYRLTIRSTTSVGHQVIRPHALGNSITNDLSIAIVPQASGAYALVEMTAQGAADPICPHTHADFSKLSEWFQRGRKDGEVLCPTCAGRDSAPHQRPTNFMIAGILRRVTLREAREEGTRELSSRETTNRRIFYYDGRQASLLRWHYTQRDQNSSITPHELPMFPSVSQLVQHMADLDRLCVNDMAIHYTYTGDIDAEKKVYQFRTNHVYRIEASMLAQTLAVKVGTMWQNPNTAPAVIQLLDLSKLINRHGRVAGVVDLEDAMRVVANIANNPGVFAALGYGRQALRIAVHFAEVVRRFSTRGDVADTAAFAQLWGAILGQEAVMRFMPGPERGIWDIGVWEQSKNQLRMDPEFEDIPLEMFGTGFADTNNYELANDAVSGMRVSALVHAGISPAFATVVDFFGCNADVRGHRTSRANLFVVMESEDVSIGRHMGMLGAIAPLHAALPEFRSIIAQVLLALEASHKHLQFTHNDLHPGNVFLGPATNPDATYYQFRRPRYDFYGDRVLDDDRDFFIRTDDLEQRRIVRFIDFGRSRCDHPQRPRDQRAASGVSVPYMDKKKLTASSVFNMWADMRVFAHDLAILQATGGTITPFNGAFYDDNADEANVADEILEVLERMTGMDKWHFRMPLHYRTEILSQDLRGRLDEIFRVVMSQPPGRRLRRLVQMRAQTTSEQRHAMDEFRIFEMYGAPPWQYDLDLPSPSDILNHTFFDVYRSRDERDPNRHHNIDFVGDATRDIED